MTADLTELEARMIEAHSKMIALKVVPNRFYLVAADFAEFLEMQRKLDRPLSLLGYPVYERRAGTQGKSGLYSTRGRFVQL